MSYLTAECLSRELARLYHEKPESNGKPVHVARAPSVRFVAYIGKREIDFSIPEEVLQSSPLSFVSDNYLAPLLERTTTAP